LIRARRIRIARNDCRIVFLEIKGERDDDRERRIGDEREAPVEEEQHHRDADEHQEVAEDRDDALRDHVRERVDVVRDPGHEPADRVAVEERERERLQVPEQLDPQVVHRALADVRRQDVLGVPECRRCEQDPEVCGTKRYEQPEALGRGDAAADCRRDGLVDEELRDDRRCDVGERQQHQEAECDRDEPAIRPQVRKQAPHEPRVVGLAEDLIFLEEAGHQAPSPMPPPPIRVTESRGGRLLRGFHTPLVLFLLGCRH